MVANILLAKQLQTKPSPSGTLTPPPIAGCARPPPPRRRPSCPSCCPWWQTAAGPAAETWLPWPGAAAGGGGGQPAGRKVSSSSQEGSPNPSPEVPSTQQGSAQQPLPTSSMPPSLGLKPRLAMCAAYAPCCPATCAVVGNLSSTTSEQSPMARTSRAPITLRRRIGDGGDERGCWRARGPSHDPPVIIAALCKLWAYGFAPKPNCQLTAGKGLRPACPAAHPAGTAPAPGSAPPAAAPAGGARCPRSTRTRRT